MADLNSLTQTIYTCLEKAGNLKIVTYVGEVKSELISDAQTETLKLKWTNLPQGNLNFVLATQINLLEGDIVNVIPDNVKDKQ